MIEEETSKKKGDKKKKKTALSFFKTPTMFLEH
jgi:hypothetical protein